VPGRSNRVARDLEIQNAQKQIELNQNEIQKLTKKLEGLSGAEKLIQLESKVKLAASQKAELEKGIKQMEKQNAEQGKALDKLSNGVESHNKIRNLVEELRVWKEKVQSLKQSCKKNKETRLEQVERIKRVEQENARHKGDLDAILVKKKPVQTSRDLMTAASPEQVVKDKEQMN
jgi:uncharacterized coiled-coil protein SlyX